MGWGPEKSRLFVKLYLSHKCLWNIEDADYKLKPKRLESYQDICKKFYTLTNTEINESEVKNKIKSFRSTYVQYLQKLRRKQLCLEDLYKSLIWFKDMHRCFSSINIPRNLYGEGVSYDDQQDLETDFEEEKIWVPDEITGEEISEESKDPFISPTNDDYILLLKNEPLDDDEPVPYKRKRKFKWRNRESCSSSQSRNSVKETMSKEDEFDIYGKYIASQLREMGLQRALRVQLQIQNIVSEARLDSLSD